MSGLKNFKIESTRGFLRVKKWLKVRKQQFSPIFSPKLHRFAPNFNILQGQSIRARKSKSLSKISKIETTRGFLRVKKGGRKSENNNFSSIFCRNCIVSRLTSIFYRGRPAKKSRRERDDKRMQAEQIRKAEEQAAVFKVRSSTHESATKRCYKVSNSSVGKAQYEVVISSACSCSCPYAQKFAGRISCKHVVFVWVSVLKGKTEDLAGFIPDETLRQVFSQSTSVPAELLLEKRSRRTRAELRKLLEESPFFKDDQVWAVGPKMGRPAKCFGCRDKLEVGTKCVTIEGALKVPYDGNVPRKERMFSHPLRSCYALPPQWTNIRFPTKFADDGSRDFFPNKSSNDAE